MENTTCKNCGGDYAIHHFETNQCPVGGCEAPIGRKQEWKSTTFEAKSNDVAELRETVDQLTARIEALEAQVSLKAKPKAQEPVRVRANTHNKEKKP
jgi:hypothetical protein